MKLNKGGNRKQIKVTLILSRQPYKIVWRRPATLTFNVSSGIKDEFYYKTAQNIRREICKYVVLYLHKNLTTLNIRRICFLKFFYKTVLYSRGYGIRIVMFYLNHGANTIKKTDFFNSVLWFIKTKYGMKNKFYFIYWHRQSNPECPDQVTHVCIIF